VPLVLLSPTFSYSLQALDTFW